MHYTKQEQPAAPRASMASSPRPLDHPCRPPLFHAAVHGDGGDPACNSRLLHILRKWRRQCRTPSRPNLIAAPPSPSRSTTSSCCRSVLNFIPFRCIPSSTRSFLLNQDADHLEDGDGDLTDDSNHMNSGSDPQYDQDAKRLPSPVWSHRHPSPTPSPAVAGSTCKPAPSKVKISTDCHGEERYQAPSPCEKKPIRAPARRALSCPKLGSPLRSCTAFAGIQDEEFECLRASYEEDDDDDHHHHQSHNTLRRAASSPAPRRRSSKISTPRGYLALYVGQERRRFLVKANLLNHPLFSILLEKAREEFGFAQKGPLTIPCDVAFFQRIMFLVESNDPSIMNADHSSTLLSYGSLNQLAAPVV